MNYYNMMDVGDGLCFSFSSGLDLDESVFQIDCGTNRNQDPKIAFDKFDQLPSPHNIILSHFHTDHYNGFQWGAKHKASSKPFIKNVYYPGIPQFDKEPMLAKEFLYCLLWSTFPRFGKRSGRIVNDFLAVIGELKGSSSFKHAACFKGDIIQYGNTKLNVLWPPKQVKQAKIVKKVKKVIEKVYKVCEKFPEESYNLGFIREFLSDYNYYFYSEQKRDGKIVIPVEFHEQGYTTEEKMQYESSSPFIPSEIKEVNNAIIDAANNLSMVFRKEQELLFLGDVGKIQHVNICRALNDNGFKIIVAPHHGTNLHWSKRPNKAFAKVILVSNGSFLNKCLSPQIKEEGNIVLTTYASGDIHVYVKEDCCKFISKDKFNLLKALASI